MGAASRPFVKELAPLKSAPLTKLGHFSATGYPTEQRRRSGDGRYSADWSAVAAVVPAAVLQALMRHSSIATTMKYYTNITGVLDEAILKA